VIWAFQAQKNEAEPIPALEFPLEVPASIISGFTVVILPGKAGKP